MVQDSEAMMLDISIVIPVYNEAKRLSSFLSRVISYCKNSEKRYEIIVVDDGSTDDTLQIAESYKGQFPSLSTVRVRKNRGKGYAVKRGLLKSEGQICLFLDADGSTDPVEIEKNLHYISQDGYDIFIGSRVLKEKEQSLKTKWYRKAMGITFNYCVHSFLFKDVKDTQCGFKMFRKGIVKPLFARSYIRGFGFDIEILYLAYKMGYKVKEGPVSWHHVGGSKVNLFVDSIKMFFNILQIINWHCVPINPFSEYMGPDEHRYMYELEDTHWWFVSRNNLIVHLIKSLKFSLPAILDVGAGTGHNLLVFGSLGQAFGIDISPQAVEFCLKRGIKDITLCPAERIDYPDRTFDIVTCLDILEHVKNPVEVLLEVKRVLKDTGKIIIAVPALKILWSQHDEALCHLRRYDKESLLTDLNEAGLKVDKMGYFFFMSFFVVAPIRILRRFFFSRKKFQSDTTTLPLKFLNEFLKFLFRMEIKLSNRFKVPIGTTIYAIASKG